MTLISISTRRRLAAISLGFGLFAVAACSSETGITVAGDSGASATITTPAPATDASASSDAPALIEADIAPVQLPLGLAGTTFTWGRINWTVESAEVNNLTGSDDTPNDFRVQFVATFIAENTFDDEMQYADMVFTHPDSTTTEMEVKTIAQNATERIEVSRLFSLRDLGFENGEVAAATEFIANSTITLGDPRLEQIQISMDGTVTGESGVVQNAIDTTVYRDTDLYTDGAGDVTQFDIGQIQVSTDQIVGREYFPGQTGRALLGERYVAIDATVTQLVTSFGDNISSSSMVLVIDGVPHRSTIGPNESMGENAVIEGSWTFIVPSATTSLELQIFQDRGLNQNEPAATITLDPGVMTTAVAAPVTASETVSTDASIGG